MTACQGRVRRGRVAGRLAALVALGLVLAGCPPRKRNTPGMSSSRQTARAAGTMGAPQGFLEYLPPGYGDGNRRPLLVFLHGGKENGDDVNQLLASGLPSIINQDRWPAERPFVVLSPQQPGEGCPEAADVHAFLGFAIRQYAVDERRVYLTGLSCGAIGIWRYLEVYRGSQVAAVVPIAGDGRRAFETAGCALGEVGIWAFHGDKDKSVSPEGTTVPITALLGCPGLHKEAKMTIYRGVKHNSWPRTYDGSAGHDVFTWLLSFQRGAPGQ